MRHDTTQDFGLVIDGLLAIVRRETLIVAVAVQANDDVVAWLASGRLRWALACAHEFAACRPAEYARVHPKLVVARAAAELWLVEPSNEDLSPDRLQRVLAALCEPTVGIHRICADDTLVLAFDLDDLPLIGMTLRAATVTHVSAKRAWLESADASKARIARSSFEAAAMRACVFDDAELDQCNLARANLERTRWRGTSLTGCWAMGAVFLDAHLENARFTDCDLRDADFQCLTESSTVNVEFRNCDLRGTRWSGRDLSRVMFVGCKMYGIHGTVTGLGEAVIDEADLSPAGEQLHRATKRQVLAGWWPDGWATSPDLGRDR